jgi:hypothetical protein
MRLVVLSFFRNAAGAQVQRFMRQVSDLMDSHPSNNVALVAVYGDCTDNTRDSLQANANALDIPISIVRHDHGGPIYGSTESLQRMRDLSGVANAGLDEVFAITKGNCEIFYVESDLIWDAKTVLRLSDKLDASEDADAIAPLVFAGEHFYDVYSFRGLDGSRFSPFKPYHQTMSMTELTEVSSVGSAFIMEGWILKDTRITNHGALPGFWEEARRNGHHVYVDPTEKVVHPA